VLYYNPKDLKLSLKLLRERGVSLWIT